MKAALQSSITENQLRKKARKLPNGVKEALKAYIDGLGMSYLHQAASSGKTLVCSTLILEIGIDPNLTDKEGRTALHHAAIQDDAALIQELINHDASTISSDNTNALPIHLAALHGNVNAFKKLAEFPGVDVEGPLGMPIHMAARTANLELLNAVIRHAPATIDNVMYGFLNPLALCIFAQATSSLDCIKALVQAGANLNEISLLEKAVRFSSSELVKYLITNGADANSSDGGVCENQAIESALVLKREDLLLPLMNATNPFLSPEMWSVDGLQEYADSSNFKQKVSAHASGRIEVLKARIHKEATERHFLAAEALCKLLRCDVQYMTDGESVIDAFWGLISIHIHGITWGKMYEHSVEVFYQLGCVLRETGDIEEATHAFEAVRTFKHNYMNVEAILKSLKDVRQESGRQTTHVLGL
ncbi:Ankyrin repeat domain-containing protein 55 [Rhynchospora pubera]|uniref:Ankyrin repeat domain-containing protein 55 n=1 Tax=Rhynchospora pubera TaxID=906938 RepID=A0AAV8EAC7_9POAL|nr:Ankyrin repeat domain-containing protein 55 [Rhynchospora pubera]